MTQELWIFSLLLGFLLFLVYWIFGGVYFAVISLGRLGQIRQVRFSCLFSLWALLLGFGAGIMGIRFSLFPIQVCLEHAQGKSDVISSIFGCGFTGVGGSFLIGVCLLFLGGYVLLSLSKTNHTPWTEQPPEPVPPSPEAPEAIGSVVEHQPLDSSKHA